MTRHTISVLVENKFGVLARIAGLFSGRGYNIHSLNVAPSQDPRFSRMTIVVREKEDVLDQIIKHLEKLVNTVSNNVLLFSSIFRLHPGGGGCIIRIVQN